MTTITSTPALSFPEVSTSENTQPEQNPPFFRRPWKIRLLLLLLGSLVVLLLFQFFIAYMPAQQPAPTTCAGLMGTADYTQAVGLQTPNQSMSAIQMVNDLDGGAPAALVQVTNNNPLPTLDVYIFSCLMQAHQPRLTRIFAEQGLVQGTIELTPEHTLITARLDNKLPPSAVAFLQPLQENVYQEYSWQENHFTQVPFAGFYPVASQTEASLLQKSFNEGEKNIIWNDPVATALQMSKDLLQWSNNTQARLVSQTETGALVELTAENPHIVLNVTLKRLIQPDNSGLWFVTDARSPGILLTQSGTLNQPFQMSVTSPITFSGANVLIDGHTTATLFDHTLAPIEQTTGIPLDVRPDGTYTGAIPYANLISGQQGVLCIQSLPLPQNDQKEAGQIVLTGVLLN
jgi:hypothetical protein